jgi:anti-sigma B factor antagonist
VEDLLRDMPGIAPGAAGGSTGGPAGRAPETAFPGVADTSFLDVPSVARDGGIGVAVSSSDGITEMRVSGHLDSGSSAALEKKLQDLIAAGATRLVVDLADISYVSSGGWGTFVGEVKNLRDRGGDIVLSGMTSEVYDVYELLGFADVLRAFKTIADARAFLALPPEARRAGVADSKAEWSPRDAGIRIEPLEGDLTREWQSLQVEATTVGESGEIAVLSLRGIIDTVSAEKLRGALDQVISGGRVRVVADMSQVEYVSSGGWGVFTERLRELRRAGGDIKLFGMDPDVYYVFTMLGFNIVLSSFDIMGEAIDDFRAPRADVELQRASVTDPAALAAPGRVIDPAPRIVTGTPGMDIVWESAREGTRIARIKGVIETTAVSLLSDELTRELDASPRAVLFDLSGVEYISSSGWGQFARAYEATRAVALFGMGPDLDEVYACLEFHSFLPAFAAEEDAQRAVLTARVQRPAPRVAPVADEEQDHNGADAGLDDVLGREAAAPRPAPAPHPAPAPEARVEKTPAAPAVKDEAERTQESPRLWGTSTWSGKNEAPGTDLDVASAKPDRNVGKDNKLRALGWEKYGKRLKHHSDAGKLKDSGDGHLDPEEGGDK